MKKFTIILFALAVVMLFSTAVSAQGLKMDHGYVMNERSANGAVMASIQMSTWNDVPFHNSDKIRFAIYMPQLGVYKTARYNSFDGNTVSEKLIAPLRKDVKPGFYTVRLVGSSDSGERIVKHRMVRIQ